MPYWSRFYIAVLLAEWEHGELGVLDVCIV